MILNKYKWFEILPRTMVTGDLYGLVTSEEGI
jgi:hypothetical protein